MKFEGLVINKIYSNNDIYNIFSCAKQGGVRVSNENKTITLISTLVRREDTNPYQDETMSNDGRIIYTGMGTKGDQRLSGQNLKIAESRINGYRLFYFEVYKEKEYTYKGELILDDEPYFTNEVDVNGNSRKVIKFKLKTKTTVDISYVSEKTLNEQINKEEKKLKKVSDSELAKLVTNFEKKPKSINVITEQYQRDLKVKQYTLRRANGKCDLCDQNAPFITDKDTPYLESHHVITLAEGGKDSIVNTVALCPNCHKKMHYSKDRKSNLNKLREKLKRYITDDVNLSYEDHVKLIEDYKNNFGG